MRTVLFVALLLIGTSAVRAEITPDEVSAHLQQCCVTLKAGYSEGSGVIVTRKVDDDKLNFVITANHVVERLRQTKQVTTSDGDKKVQISYGDAFVVQEWLDEETGERVGETKVLAKVLSVDPKRDIALLQVKAKGWKGASIEFYNADAIPGAGTPVIHCGSPGGQDIGAGSVLFGNVARVGCRIPHYSPYPFDQLTCPALGGSSGGMVVIQSGPHAGRWIGMITLGLRGSDNFHWMVPKRVCDKWVDEIGAEWLFQPDGATTYEALSQITLENSKAGFTRDQLSAEPPLAPTGYFRPLRDLTPILTPELPGSPTLIDLLKHAR